MLISRMEPMLGNSTYWSHCIPESQYRKKLQHQPHVLHFFNIFWCHYLQQKCQRSISASGILVSDKNCIFLEFLSQKKVFFLFQKIFMSRSNVRSDESGGFVCQTYSIFGEMLWKWAVKIWSTFKLVERTGCDQNTFSNWKARFYIGMPRIA